MTTRLASGSALAALRVTLVVVTLVVVTLGAGCGRVHLGTHDGGGAAEDGGATREPCGRVLCEVGLVCCNASCGSCTPPGLACIALACVECISNADCSPEEYCEWVAGSCGQPPEQGTCTPRANGCFAVVRPVCGCDGTTYGNDCEAAAAGVSVRFEGACASCRAQDAVGVGACDAVVGVRWGGARCEVLSGCSCEGADCDALFADEAACELAHAGCACAPMDALGDGACAAVFGVRWNGAGCEWVSGCGCAGVDCDRTYDTLEACERAHVDC